MSGPAAAPSPPAQIAPPGSRLRAEVDTELEQVQMAIGSFRSLMGGIPVGTNAEITRALLGDNPKQAKIPLPEGSQLNAAGELCDRWGSPYFFHQLSNSRMEVRSAGADRQLWTGDDQEVK
ncbi:MAG TPA: hypothetical protein VF593_05565 [Chthoniobacteraceae bacterium]